MSNITRRAMMAGAVGATVSAAALTTPTQALEAAVKGSPVRIAKMTLEHAALHCLREGELCMSHCLNLLSEGNAAMAECAQAVKDMLAMCGSLHKLAANKSKHIKDVAALCIKICEDCEAACRKHEHHHVECKRCAESCATCIQICKETIAASA